MVRLAEPKDIDLIYDLCKEALEASAYKNIPHNALDSRKVFAHFMLDNSIWVTDEVDGILIGGIQPLWFNHSKLAAMDVIFYVRDKVKSSGVKLAKAYMKWGKENADVVTLSISYGGDIDRAGQFFERLGFEKIGGAYILRGD